MGYILTDTIPGYELVADVTVSVATQTLFIAGLNITKDDDYLLISYIVAGGTTPSISLYADNTTATNYYQQQFTANNTTRSASRTNNAYYSYVGTSNKTSSVCNIKLTNNGYFVFQSKNEINYNTTSPYLQMFYGASTTTYTTVTSLTISASVASGLGVGSRFQLYRRKATLIADTTISGSAVTSVDFTGLNLTAGNEVMLVSEHYNNSGNPCGGSLFPNDNTTVTNFYRQGLGADGTTVASARSNSGYFLQSPTGYYHFNISNIKLTNSGHFVIQSSTNYRNSAPSTMQIDLNYITSTFTLSSITKLSIVTSVANAISVGSRFQLYLMK